MTLVSNAKERSCYKCGYFAETAETACPNCKRLLFTTTSTRIRGTLMILCGIALIGMLGYISLWALSSVGGSGESRFTGTQQEKLVIFGLFGVIIFFGFGAFVTGLGQVITGRRNKALAWAVVAIGIAIFAAAGAVYWIL